MPGSKQIHRRKAKKKKKVKSLQKLCEIVIVNSYKDIEKLPLPAGIKEKLLFHCYEEMPPSE
jgi:ribosomal 50S subunit-associated protein YjgA (DUF615 family)